MYDTERNVECGRCAAATCKQCIACKCLHKLHPYAATRQMAPHAAAPFCLSHTLKLMCPHLCYTPPRAPQVQMYILAWLPYLHKARARAGITSS
jgi:hypothetical protein